MQLSTNLHICKYWSTFSTVKENNKWDSNEPNTSSNQPKQQGGSPLPFLDHHFKTYHTTGWCQWELNVQMLAKGATQLNATNNV
eukprot:2230705-Ditylum_brightwellii.AAC.1